MKESGSQVPPQGLVFLIPHSFLKHTRSLWFNDAVTITCSHIIIFSHHFQLFCFPTINFFGPFFFKLFFFAFLETWISLSVPCRPQWRSTNLHLEKQKQKKKEKKRKLLLGSLHFSLCSVVLLCSSYCCHLRLFSLVRRFNLFLPSAPLCPPGRWPLLSSPLNTLSTLKYYPTHLLNNALVVSPI